MSRIRKTVLCKCGCGAKVKWRVLPSGFRGRGKYVPGHFKKTTKNAAFAHLDVSRERKRQLRKRAEGFCIIAGCNEPLVTENHCARHAGKKWQQAKPELQAVV
jgi:hypothetical protein